MKDVLFLFILLRSRARTHSNCKGPRFPPKDAKMTSLFSALSGPTVDVGVTLEDEQDRKQVEVKISSDASKPESERKESCPVYYDGEVTFPILVCRQANILTAGDRLYAGKP